VDGWINCPAGPGQPEQVISAIPTMTEWGMVILIGLIGMASIYSLRRQRII